MKGRILASRYQLESHLGVGGSSTVFRATDLRLDVPVAVKLLDSSVAENEQAYTRFLREAKTAAKLKHRNVAQSLDCGVDAGVPFIVMELLEGETLRERLRAKGRLSPTETARILLDVGKAMQLAHATGVVHRDLKPENVFLATENGEEVVKVLDFGIAKRSASNLETSSGVLTEPGSIFGTPHYMSPEQIDARSPVDHRADIWAIAIMAFECLTGKVPFGEETLREQFLAICARPLPTPSRVAEVPAGFDEWFARAAAQDVSARFPTIREAQSELAGVCGVEATTAATPRASITEGRELTTADGAGTTTVPQPAAPDARKPIALEPLPARRFGWVVLAILIVAAGLATRGWLTRPKTPIASPTPTPSFVAMPTPGRDAATPTETAQEEPIPTASGVARASTAPLPLPNATASVTSNVAPAASHVAEKPPQQPLKQPTHATVPRSPDLVSRAVKSQRTTVPAD